METKTLTLATKALTFRQPPSPPPQYTVNYLICQIFYKVRHMGSSDVLQDEIACPVPLNGTKNPCFLKYSVVFYFLLPVVFLSKISKNLKIVHQQNVSLKCFLFILKKCRWFFLFTCVFSISIFASSHPVPPASRPVGHHWGGVGGSEKVKVVYYVRKVFKK